MLCVLGEWWFPEDQGVSPEADGNLSGVPASDDWHPCIKLTVTLTVASWKLDIVLKSSYNCICSSCIVLTILHYSYIVLLITVLAVLLFNYLLKLTYSWCVSYVFILDVQSSAFTEKGNI